jgi:hypothetical protein
MAHPKPRGASYVRLHDKSQPRYLTWWDPVQPCSWTDCSAQAVSEYKAKVYCASHLFKILQQQWQE